MVAAFYIGWITDLTGNYDLSFYLAGFFISMSGLLMIILPSHKQYKKYCEAKKIKIEQKNSSADGNGMGVTTKAANNITPTKAANNIIKVRSLYSLV